MNELILLAGKTGYFKVDYQIIEAIGDVFTFSIGATDEAVNEAKEISAKIPIESAIQLREFLDKYISKRNEFDIDRENGFRYGDSDG